MNDQAGVLKHEAITRTIIGCAFEVINELGAGFLESVYEKALLIALRQKEVHALPKTRFRCSSEERLWVSFSLI